MPRHQESVVLLPEIKLGELEAALQDIYLRNDALKLNTLFSDLVLGSSETLENLFQKSEGPWVANIEGVTETVPKKNQKEEHQAANLEDKNETYSYENQANQYLEVELMNGTVILQCTKCSSSIEDKSLHICDDQQEIILNFETFQFANNDVVYRCIKCNTQLSTKKEAKSHLKSHKEIEIAQTKVAVKQETDIPENTKTGENIVSLKDAQTKPTEIEHNKIKKRKHTYEVRLKETKADQIEDFPKLSPKDYTPFVNYSVDDFVSKFNRKNKNILKCRKCLKKCKGAKGAKIHSKTCKKTAYLIPALKTFNVKSSIIKPAPNIKSISSNFSKKVKQIFNATKIAGKTNDLKVQKIFGLRKSIQIKKVQESNDGNDIQEVFNAPTSEYMKMHSKPTEEKRNIAESLRNVTLSVGDKVMDVSESALILSNIATCHFCKKTFTSRIRLKRHMQLNHKDKQGQVGSEDILSNFKNTVLEGGRQFFQCNRCNKMCTSASGIRRHQIRSPNCVGKTKGANTKSTPVPCDQCNKFCTSERYLKYHKNVKHSKPVTN